MRVKYEVALICINLMPNSWDVRRILKYDRLLALRPRVVSTRELLDNRTKAVDNEPLSFFS